jgi:glycosyltransferase involved in cell wall biosynthesis
MKVLHVYRTYFPDPPGGLQEAISQIASGTQAHGVESRVYALSPQAMPATVKRPEGTVFRSRSYWAPASCDLGGWSSLMLYREQLAWADLVHFHYPWPFADVLNTLSPTRKPKVMTYHSDIVKQKVLGKLYHPLMRWTLSQMDAVVATSPTYAQTSTVLQRFVAPHNIHVVPLCMHDVLPAWSASSRTDIVDRLGLRHKPYVMALGVLRYYKGLHSLVEAAQKIRGTVVIAGSGPEDAHLRAQVAALGLHNVVFAGQVSHTEKHDLLSQCVALTLPSHMRSEAFGMVLLEAAMHGKPQISCEIGTGTSWVNQDGQTGWVVPPEDPQALAQAINRLMDNPQQALAMGQQARQRYETQFAPHVMADGYNAIYQQVLSSSTAKTH